MEMSQLTPRQFELFRDFIYRHSGIRMDVSKISLATNRIRRRVKANQLAGFEEYYKFIVSSAGADELEHFLDAVTTNETHFFRTPQHFDWFKTEFVNDLLSRDRQGDRPRQIRVWSAACSTGEEAYSLAICLWENSLRLKDWKLSVVGTDISERVIKEARQAVYKQRAVEEVEPARLKRHFDHSAEAGTYTIRPHVRDLVTFARHNLMLPMRMPQFDCIFIRNVLIYFDRQSKATVIEQLVRALNRGGYLVVGPSEGVYDMLEPLTKRSTFLYQKP